MFLQKSFYFFYHAVVASLLPFLVIFYDQLGLSGSQIGFLVGIPPLMYLIGAPIWGGLADSTQKHKLILVLAITGTLVLVPFLLNISLFLILIPVIAAFAFFLAPIMPLVDNSVMDMLGELKIQYGKQRLWGAVGWGIAGPITGWLIDRSGIQWAFYCYLLLMFLGLIIALYLPIGNVSIGGKFWQEFRLLLSNRQWLLFLVMVFIGSLGISIGSNFIFLYLDDLGASKTLMGLCLTFNTLGEIPFLYYSDRFLRKWGARGLLILALLTSSIRAFAYSLIKIPWLVLPIQLLHGPSYAALWVAGVTYADEVSPPGLGATAQGLFAAVFMGFSYAIGAFIGGYLYENAGPVAMFRWMGAFVLLGLISYLLIGKNEQNLKQPIQ
jgi:PPP family 3-phenylpropionic acid transporter